VGKVFQAQSAAEDTHSVQRKTTSVMKEWKQLILSMRIYPTGEAVIEAYWRTLVAGANKENEDAPAEIGKHFAQWYDQLGSSAFDLSDFRDGKSSESKTSSKLYGSCVQETCQGRWLIITNKGYVGLGVKGRLQGDYIAILSGNNFPCLLRSEGNCFNLLENAIFMD
jgi:hypothetical protein